MPKKRAKNPPPKDWRLMRSSVVITREEIAAFHEELKKLKPVNPYTPKPPITRNAKTGEVRDATGRLLSIFGPRSWRALKSEIRKKV